MGYKRNRVNVDTLVTIIRKKLFGANLFHYQKNKRILITGNTM